MGYSLPNVKPHVVAAANEIGPKFGIKTIGGWRAHDQFPDHPSGLALDFMIDNIPNGHAVGEALAAYIIANAARLGVKYMIWYRRSWNPTRRTWVPYSSTTNPHTDHVHVSFNSKAGTGGSIIDTIDTNPVGNPVGDLTDQYKTLMDTLGKFSKAADWLSNSRNWMRINYVMLGSALVIGVLLVLFFQTDAPRIIGEAAGVA